MAVENENEPSSNAEQEPNMDGHATPIIDAECEADSCMNDYDWDGSDPFPWIMNDSSFIPPNQNQIEGSYSFRSDLAPVRDEQQQSRYSREENVSPLEANPLPNDFEPIPQSGGISMGGWGAQITPPGVPVYQYSKSLPGSMNSLGGGDAAVSSLSSGLDFDGTSSSSDVATEQPRWHHEIGHGSIEFLDDGSYRITFRCTGHSKHLNPRQQRRSGWQQTNRSLKRRWSPEEDGLILRLRETDLLPWDKVAERFSEKYPDRTKGSVVARGSILHRRSKRLN